MLGVLVAYAAAALAIGSPLHLVDRTHLPTCACGDVAQEVWILSLAQVSLAHGSFAWSTTLIDHPSGVNLLDNASFPLLSVVVAPLTAAVGPVAALVVLLRVAFLASAAAGFAVLRRLTGSTPGAALGGALYGFSPFMTHQAASHFFLVCSPLPPVMLLVAHEALTGRRRSPLRAGLLLGALAVAQCLVESEVLIEVVVVAGATVAVLGAARLVGRRPLRARTVALGRLLLGACLVAVPLLAPVAAYAVLGPHHVVGATEGNGGIDPLATLLPTGGGLLAGVVSPWRAPAQQYLGDGSFVGIPLLLAAGATAWVRRRDPLVRTTVVLTGVAWVLQLGTRLELGTEATPVPLPFAVLTHVPVLQDLLAGRMALFVDLGVAVLVAVGVADLLGALRAAPGPAPRPARRGGRLRAGLGLVALVGCTCLDAPVATYGAAGIGGALAFAGPARLHLAPGALVAAYPYPAFPDDQAMLWQAESGMGFTLLGGYAIRPGLDGRSTRAPLVLPPGTVPDVFSPAAVGGVGAGSALEAYVARYRVADFLVDTGAAGAGPVVRLLTRCYGPPVGEDGVDQWRTGPAGLPGDGGDSAGR